MNMFTTREPHRLGDRLRPWVRRRDERGMATSEYAVGTVGACGIAGILYELANSDFFTNLLQDVVGKVVDLLPF